MHCHVFILSYLGAFVVRTCGGRKYKHERVRRFIFAASETKKSGQKKRGDIQ